MVTKDDVSSIATLCDVGIDEDEMEQFTEQFSDILAFWSTLDELTESDESGKNSNISNVFREDIAVPSLSQEQALSNTDDATEGYFNAPRVM
ncbi:MAG: Asp-tRNA(Asn)/Glu-tRNA(Gln) amidotransferase subunit GatC [Euryarchaeota archaeon]|nr:Asp-tRNA(Asn)/Glu-tRNA(Gln) amidotransferase subunit GatC [Euryarchaeota archaeon]